MNLSPFPTVLTLRSVVVVAVAVAVAVHRVVNVVVHVVVHVTVAVDVTAGASIAGTRGTSSHAAAVHLVFVMIVLIVGAQEWILVRILRAAARHVVALLQFVREISHSGHCKRDEGGRENGIT